MWNDLTLIEAGSGKKETKKLLQHYECPFVCFLSYSRSHDFLASLLPSHSTHTNIIQYFIMTWISYRSQQHFLFSFLAWNYDFHGIFIFWEFSLMVFFSLYLLLSPIVNSPSVLISWLAEGKFLEKFNVINVVLYFYGFLLLLIFLFFLFIT